MPSREGRASRRRVFVKAARAGLALGAIAGAVAYTVASELMPIAPSFLRENLIEPHKRTQLLATTAVAMVAVVLVAFVSWLRNRQNAWIGLSWLARAMSPLLVSPLVAALFRRDFADAPQAAILLGFVVVLTERLVRVSLEAMSERPEVQPLAAVRARLQAALARPALPLAIVIVAAIVQGVYMSLFAVWSHQRFGTFGYDLGQYHSIFANTLAGRPLHVPALGWDYDWGELLNGHADLGTFYMLPIFALYPRAPTLLVMQSTLIASAAIPLFLLARKNLSPGWGVVLALAWLGYPPLHGAQLYDVHMQPFGMSWAMWAVWAVDARRFKNYWLFFTLAILCREDVSIGLCMLGAFLWLSEHRPKTGFFTALFAGCYFLVLRFSIMKSSYFADAFKELYPLGEHGFGAVLKTIASNPGYYARSLITWEKLRYALQVFAPIAFLPLRRPAMYAVLVPGFLLTLTTTAYAPTISISFQYVCNWATYSFAASVAVLTLYGADALGQRRRLAAGVTLVLGIVLANQQWGAWTPSPVVHGGFLDVAFAPPTAADLQRDDDLQTLMKQVPPDAKLCSSDKTQPHVTWHLGNWSLRDALYDCEFLIFTDVVGDLGNDRGRSAIASGQYAVVETVRGVTLARRVSPPAP